MPDDGWLWHQQPGDGHKPLIDDHQRQGISDELRPTDELPCRIKRQRHIARRYSSQVGDVGDSDGRSLLIVGQQLIAHY